jgi:transcriptional regulator with XRE-family HTH domain
MNIHFGQCLRAFLREKKLTQVEVAARLGMSQRTVSYYCRSENPPRPHVLDHMAARLGVTADELLGKGHGTTHRVSLVKESAPKYQTPDPWLAWPKQLRAAYAKNPDVVASALRAAWGQKTADQIIAWLQR